MRGLRGATTIEQNTKEEIWKAAQELMMRLLSRNRLKTEDIGAAIFSCTKDITAAFPTAGLRQLPGFDLVPLFDAQEMDVEGSLPMCIRVLLLLNVDRNPAELQHVYLRGATMLRPDLGRRSKSF
mgnify:CR=1 FL=1